MKSCCEGKKLEHCGECGEFPCSTLQEFAYAKQEGDEGVRLDQCKIWNAAQFMRYPWIDEFLMAKKGVEKLPPQWNWIRYAVGGKMFAAVCLGEEDIIPGYYMNKTHWNSVKPNGNVPDELLKDLLEKSYFLVLGGFSKKKQREILGGAEKGIYKKPD